MKDLKVKVCGLKEPSNIREIAQLAPDYMGFIFYPASPRYVGNDLPVRVLNELPVEIKRVGVFVNEDVENILRTTRKYGLAYVQLHGDESPEQCNSLRNSGIKVIKAIHVENRRDIETARIYHGYVDYLLFDTKGKYRGGNGIPFDWRLLENKVLQAPIFLSGGIGISEVHSIMASKEIDPFAIDINSKFELEPGVKNLKLVEQAIHQIRAKSKIYGNS